MSNNVQTLPKLRTLLTTVSTLLMHHASAASSYACAPEPLLFAVGVHQPLNPCLELSTEEWEDLCRECGGWEWIDGEIGGEMGKGKGGRDEYGGRSFFHSVISFQACSWVVI